MNCSGNNHSIVPSQQQPRVPSPIAPSQVLLFLGALLENKLYTTYIVVLSEAVPPKSLTEKLIKWSMIETVDSEDSEEGGSDSEKEEQTNVKGGEKTRQTSGNSDRGAFLAGLRQGTVDIGSVTNSVAGTASIRSNVGFSTETIGESSASPKPTGAPTSGSAVAFGTRSVSGQSSRGISRSNSALASIQFRFGTAGPDEDGDDAADENDVDPRGVPVGRPRRSVEEEELEKKFRKNFGTKNPFSRKHFRYGQARIRFFKGQLDRERNLISCGLCEAHRVVVFNGNSYAPDARGVHLRQPQINIKGALLPRTLCINPIHNHGRGKGRGECGRDNACGKGHRHSGRMGRLGRCLSRLGYIKSGALPLSGICRAHGRGPRTPR